MEKETRIFETEIEVREEGSVKGYAAVFNSDSNDLGGFTERIAPGFFDDVLGDDVRVLFNHDSNYVLGRTKSGTARIGVDERGLYYEYDDPNTTQSSDLMKLMKRGDVNQSSFGFTVREDKWDKREDGTVIRTLLKAGRLYDVSPVTYPAYPDTSVAARSMEKMKDNTAKIEADKVKRDQELRNIDL